VAARQVRAGDQSEDREGTHLPFGTKVRVTVPATNKSVVVRITDRGPNIRDRVLDLSLGAARNLGIRDKGVVEIRAEVL